MPARLLVTALLDYSHSLLSSVALLSPSDCQVLLDDVNLFQVTLEDSESIPMNNILYLID